MIKESNKIFFYVNPKGKNDFRFEPCNETEREQIGFYIKLHYGELQPEFIEFFIDRLTNEIFDYIENSLDIDMAKFIFNNAFDEFYSI